MNCTCNDVLLSWVRGNAVNLTLFLKQNNTEFFVDGYDDWGVELLKNGVVKTPIKSALDDNNRIVINVPDTLAAGDYTLVVTMKKGEAGRRSAQCGVIRIVDCDEEANVTYSEVGGVATANIEVSFQLTESVWAQPLNDYELWKQIEGNEDKTLQDFINETIMQSDWAQADTNAPDYIKNKPTQFGDAVILEASYMNILGAELTHWDFTWNELVTPLTEGKVVIVKLADTVNEWDVYYHCVIHSDSQVWLESVLGQNIKGYILVENNGNVAILSQDEVTLQAQLVSGTNIKTINNQSLLGSGNITIQGGGGSGTIDNALSTSSENAVQNKVITNAINTKQDTINDLATIRSGAALGATALQSQAQADWNEADNTAADYIKNKPTLFSGDYNDLTNKPTIPAAQVQADWGQVDNTATDYIKNKPASIVNSVNGQTGAVTLSVGETNVIDGVQLDGALLTPDANKIVDVKAEPRLTQTSTNSTTMLVGCDEYFRPSSVVNTMTFELISPTRTNPKKTLFDFTTGASPNIIFTSYNNATTVTLLDGLTFVKNTHYFVYAYWTGSAWVVYSPIHKEDTKNKVTSIGANSTDTQYPSALCMYNATFIKADKYFIHQVSNSASLSMNINEVCILANAVDTITIKLPNLDNSLLYPTDTILCFETGTTPAITFAVASGSSAHIYTSGLRWEANTKYEVNVLWNGFYWTILATKLELLA